MNYMNEQYLFFIDRASYSVITRKAYRSDEEYLEIMDSMDGNAWELIVSPEACEALKKRY